MMSVYYARIADDALVTDGHDFRLLRDTLVLARQVELFNSGHFNRLLRNRHAPMSTAARARHVGRRRQHTLFVVVFY